MTAKRGGKNKGKLIITFVILFALVAGGLAGYFVFFQGGFNLRPGEISYSEEIDPVAKEFIESTLSESDLKLEKDVVISSTRENTIDSDKLIYNIYLPVTDFYNPVSNVSLEEAEQGTLIPFSELTNKVKLLAIDGEYYLDTLESGAFFDIIEPEGDSEDIAKIIEVIKPALPKWPTHEEILTLAQTGVTALSRGMNGKLLSVKNPHHFAANIAEYLSSFDLTHTSNEASFSSSAPSNNGTTMICALPDMVEVLTDIGLDIVELTGNHNQDCGNQAALDTLETYQTLGIRTFGGGKDATTAAEPLLIEQKGNNITLLGYNLSTGGYTLGQTPGANFYTAEKAQKDISDAKARGDFVIVDVQYYECNNYDHITENTACDYASSSAGDQIKLFRELIGMGADVVVGTAAHQPQTYELYGDGVIYYGLGNLFFDQSWWPGTTRSLILAHYFYDGKLLQTQIVPTIYDANLQTTLMDTESAEAFINRLNQARPQQ